MTDPTQLIAERRKTHGDWNEQSALADKLLALYEGSSNWRKMKPHQRQAMIMDAVKNSRILTGNPDEPDHWDDKAGYAKLGKGGHAPVNKAPEPYSFAAGGGPVDWHKIEMPNDPPFVKAEKAEIERLKYMKEAYARADEMGEKPPKPCDCEVCRFEREMEALGIKVVRL